MIGRAVLGLLLATACAAPPRDPFREAERAMSADDLAGALLAYDAVPVAHPHYPEARAAAAGVERRMRRGHEVLLDGLLLRSEWRDDEALTQLRRARDIWPGLPGIDALITATNNRMALFARGDRIDGSAPEERSPAPVPSAGEAEAARVVALESPATFADVAPMASPDLPPSTTADVARSQSAEDHVGKGLIAVERRLGRGELELAVVDLLELAKQHPDEVRIRVHLVRVLHQRALVRYGQGALTGAMEDWARVLELDPEHRLARSLLRAASAEASLAVPAR